MTSDVWKSCRIGSCHRHEECMYFPCRNISNAVEQTAMTSEEQIKHMTERFLAWKLPENFNPDAGISFDPFFNVEYNAKKGKPPQRHEPIGTNLLDYTQAVAMVRYMVAGIPAMTSELRPAVEVFRDANIAFNKTWENTKGSAERVGPSNQAAAAVIEADREAVRAEQAAYLAKARKEAGQNHDLHMAAVNKVVDLKAELAKFKALAETLAGALEQMHRAVCHETGFAEAVRADSGVAYPWEPLDVAADASIKALTSYKEQRDA